MLETLPAIETLSLKEQIAQLFICGVDSHLDLPVLLHSHSRLTAIELPPFQAAIANGVDTIMSAHLLIPSWDEEKPAT